MIQKDKDNHTNILNWFCPLRQPFFNIIILSFEGLKFASWPDVCGEEREREERDFIGGHLQLIVVTMVMRKGVRVPIHIYVIASSMTTVVPHQGTVFVDLFSKQQTGAIFL